VASGWKAKCEEVVVVRDAAGDMCKGESECSGFYVALYFSEKGVYQDLSRLFGDNA
jgi:hypothetical protein